MWVPKTTQRNFQIFKICNPKHFWLKKKWFCVQKNRFLRKIYIWLKSVNSGCGHLLKLGTTYRFFKFAFKKICCYKKLFRVKKSTFTRKYLIHLSEKCIRELENSCCARLAQLSATSRISKFIFFTFWFVVAKKKKFCGFWLKFWFF